MDNSPFQNLFNNSPKDPFYSQFFQAQNNDSATQSNHPSEEEIKNLSNIVFNTSSTASSLENEFNEEKLNALAFLVAYSLFVGKNKINEDAISHEVGLAFNYRKNFFERTIYDFFDKLSDIPFDKIFPFLDKLNNIFPGVLKDKYNDKKAKIDSGNFIDEIIFASTSKPEWPSLYKRDENVEVWIRETTDFIVNDIILKNFPKNSYNLSNLRPDQVCKLFFSLYFSLNKALIPLTRYFDTDTNNSEELKTMSGVVINGLCYVRDGILCNICREILTDRSPTERDALFKYLDDFLKINKKSYNLPSAEDFTSIGSYAQQILLYRDNIHKYFCNARKFFELKNILPKIEDYNLRISESEYFKNFSSPLLYPRESLSPVGDIVFFLDNSFSPLKYIHFNGREHYTQFIFDDIDKNNESLVVTGNVINKRFDRIYVNSTRSIILDSNGRTHVSYDERFASEPTDNWYQSLNNIMTKVDSTFRKIIFKEWEECPLLYSNLANSNPLVYFLFGNVIFTATDDTFPTACFENRINIDVSVANPDSAQLFNHFFPNGCKFTQAKYLVEPETSCEKPEVEEPTVVNSEALAWDRIKKFLPSNGKITMSWLFEYLSALGELEYNKDRGKGSHYILRIKGYNGFSTLSKDFRERLDDAGCFQKHLKEILESIMGDDYSLETFAEALERKYGK